MIRISDAENQYVLGLVQALLGGVTPNLRAAAIECVGDEVRLVFLLRNESPEDREEIDDIVFEFEALQETVINLDIKVVVSNKPLETLGLPRRKVYLQKE